MWQYKPFHNQLAKPGFPQFTRLLLARLLTALACETLGFGDSSPFARFGSISIQDGTSFAVKPSLAELFPGRFTTVSPAAVELHVNLDILSETVNFVTRAPDCEAERQFLPSAGEMRGALLLADKGYFSVPYLDAIQQAGSHYLNGVSIQVR